MNKKALWGLIAVAVIAVGGAVAWMTLGSGKQAPVSDVKEKDITLINGKQYLDGDVKDFVDEDAEYQYELKDKVLEKVLDAYYSDIDYEDNFNGYKEYMEKEQGVKWTEEEEQEVRKQMKYSKQIQTVYDKLIQISDDDVEKVTKDGYPIVVVEHAIISPDVYAKDKSVLKKVKDQIQNAKTDEDLDKLRATWEKNGNVDMMRSQMSKDTVIPGFESILSKNVGDVERFGEDNYVSVMKVLEKRNASKDEVSAGLRNGRILVDYPTVEDLLFAMEKEYKGLQFSEGIREALTKGTVQETSEPVNDEQSTDTDSTGTESEGK